MSLRTRSLGFRTGLPVRTDAWPGGCLLGGGSLQAGHVPCLPMGLPLLGNLCPQTQRTWPLGTAWRLPPQRAMFPARPGNSPGPLAALSAWLQRGGQKVTGHCFIAPAAFPRPGPAGLGPCLAARASVQHGDMGARSVSGRPRWPGWADFLSPCAWLPRPCPVPFSGMGLWVLLWREVSTPEQGEIVSSIPVLSLK